MSIDADRRAGRFVEAFAVQASVPESATQALQRDGVVCLQNAFGESWLSLVEQGISLALDGASADVDIVHRDGDAGSFSFSSGAWQRVEPFRRFIFDSPLADLVWPLMGSEQLVLFYDFLLIKQARSDSASTPWHQDHSYYPLDGSQIVNSWVALDDIPVDSALRFLRGSHAPAITYRAVDFADPAAAYRHARTDRPLPPHAPSGDQILLAPLSRGDMLVWWSHTLHSAPGNTLDRRRAAFSINWVGDNVVHNGQAALDTYLDPSLRAGDPIICEKFPLVRPTSAAKRSTH